MCVSERAVVEAGVVFVAPATRPHCGSTCSLTPHKGAVLLTPGCTGPSLSLRGGVGARCVCVRVLQRDSRLGILRTSPGLTCRIQTCAFNSVDQR